MARTLRTVEAEPAARPSVEGLSAAAAAIPADVVWSRLEGWCAHRWGVREVVFLVEGCGPWEAPLRPATVALAERWTAGAWVAFDPVAAPVGMELPAGEDPFRITATVGDATAPAAVLEAFRRLAEFMAQASAEIAGGHGANTSGRDGDFGFARPTGWAAQALHLSGASDLLRPWRHLGAV